MSGRDESRNTINVQGTVETLDVLHFQNHLQTGIKARFQFGLVLLKKTRF